MALQYDILIGQASHEGLALHQDGVIVVANRVLGEYLKRPPADLVGVSLLDFVAPECRRWLTPVLRGSAGPVEVTFQRSDATQFPAEVRGRTVPWEGQVVHGVAIRDVGRYQQMEEALRRSELHLEAAQAQAGLGSWEVFPETGAAHWSREMFRLFGLDASSGVPTLDEFLRLIHSNDRGPVQAAHARALAGQRSTVEFRTNPQNGPIRYLSAKVYSIRDAGGRVHQLSGTLLDITDRKLAEQAVKEGEELYRQLFESAPIGIGLADAEGRLLAFNDAMLRPGGYTRQDVQAIGNVRHLYADPTERERLLGLVRERGGVLRQHEIKFKRRDGTTYDAALSLAPVKIRDKSCMLAMVEDITLRKAAEQALRESETRWRVLIEQSYDAIAMFDPDGTTRYVSPSIRRVLGYEPDDLIGQPGLELVHPDDVDASNAALERSVRDPDKVVHLTVRMRHADGTYRTIQITGRNLLAEPSVGAMVGNFHDITAERRAEAQLRRSEAKYRAFFEQASVGIFHAAADGSFGLVNPALARILGCASVDDALAIEPTDLYADPTQRDRVFQSLAQDGYVAATEVQWRRRDGSLITVRLAGHATESNGEPSGFEMMAEDVTHERALEEQLRHSQKMEAIGSLTGGIAHDFNNLLTAVIGRAELLREQLSTAQPDLEADIDGISVAASHGADMVRKLLAFSRKDDLHIRALDLARLSTETAQMLQRLLPETVEVVVRTAPAPCVVHADANAVQQILLNLTTNARDAMPEGGTLTVEVQPVEADRVIVAPGHEGRGFVSLSVTDTGVGMEDATRTRIFDPFFTTKAVGAGTGLGMSMIYGIVAQHRGYIHVESEVGRGTSVSVYFPAAEAADAADEHDAEAHQGAEGRGEAILVVEDYEPIRRLAGRVLPAAGYRVFLAADGEAALEILEAKSGDIELVVTDVVMPKIGGRELHHRARAMGCDVPFIFTSGYSETVHSQAARDSLPGALLSKPWNLEELKRCIRTTLDAHRPTATSR